MLLKYVASYIFTYINLHTNIKAVIVECKEHDPLQVKI